MYHDASAHGAAVMSTTTGEDDGNDGSILVLSAANVASVLDRIAVSELVANQGDVFVTLSEGVGEDKSSSWQAPLRTSVSTARHTHLFMPSRLRDNVAIKCVAVPDANANAPPGLPALGVQFAPSSGRANVILNVSQLTGVRTAAGCLSASIAIRGPSAERGGTVVVFGTGCQGRWHARLFAQYYTLAHVVIVSTNAKAAGDKGLAQQWKDEIARDHVQSVKVAQQGTDDMYAALSRADFVCCCTPSTKPLFVWDSVRWTKNVHFSLIGSYKPHMQEVEPQCVQRAAQCESLYVDSLEACASEAGDLLKSDVPQQQWKEIGRLMIDQRGDAARHDAKGRQHGSRLSMFKSVGFALQDLAVIDLVVRFARSERLGQNVPFF